MKRITYTNLLLTLTLSFLVTPPVRAEISQSQSFYLTQYLDADPMNNTPSSSEYVIEDKPSYDFSPASSPKTPPEKPQNHSPSVFVNPSEAQNSGNQDFPTSVILIQPDDPTNYTPSASGFPSLEDKPRNNPPAQSVTKNQTPNSAPPITSVSRNNHSNGSRKSLSDVLNDLAGIPRPTISNSNPELLATNNSLGNNRYRVIVDAQNTSQQEKIRNIYPEAFATSYKGRTVLQIGVFNSQENASSAIETLKNHNLTGIMLRI